MRSKVGRLGFLQVAHFFEGCQSVSCQDGFCHLDINSQLFRAFLRLTRRRFDIVIMKHIMNGGDTMVMSVGVVMVVVVGMLVVMRHRMGMGMGMGMGVRVGVGMRGLLIGD